MSLSGKGGEKNQDDLNRTVDQRLADLHRKYRILEGDRKSYTEESQNIIRKQKATIDKLKKDNEALKEELAFESKKAMQQTGSSHIKQIQKLQEQGDMYTRKIELEKRRIEELDKQIKLMNVKIMEQRQKMGGVNAAKENNSMIAKQIRILENRLDKALQKFNEALAHNKRLREEIDNLRRERVVFDGIYKRLEKELQEKKKEMANIIEISNLAYEARDQAQNEMIVLKAQADKEQAQFEAEWKELGKLIEQDRKMKDFMKLKEAQKGNEKDVRGDMSLEDEGKLKKKVMKGNWSIAKDKANMALSLEKVQSYEEAFAKIQAATGISNIDNLVTTFINAEDQNFSLFNYVNELNNEIEKLEEQIADIKSEIEKYKGQGLNTDNQRKKILKDLEDKLAKTESKAEFYEQKFNQSMKTVNALKQGIQSIFNKIGCNNNQMSEMLGNAGVTESNMMQYLGIIEQRTNEILQMYALAQVQGHGGSGGEQQSSLNSILGQGPTTPVGATQISIQPPSTGDEYDSDDDEDDDDDERPLTREELKAKTLRGLNKREISKHRPVKGGKNKKR